MECTVPLDQTPGDISAAPWSMWRIIKEMRKLIPAPVVSYCQQSLNSPPLSCSCRNHNWHLGEIASNSAESGFKYP